MAPSSTRVQPSKNNLIHSVVDEFLCKSSIHGAEYVLHRDLNWFTRLLWLISLILAGWGAWATSIVYIDYSNRPVDLIVAQTNLEGISIPFPALTICPISSVRRTVGLDYIRRYLSIEGQIHPTEEQLLHALAILQAFRFPIFNNVIKHSVLFNDQLKLKESFLSINITDLAIKAFPRCEDVFVDCFLNNAFVNCCEIFHIHYTNFGLCYSFNSYSSENRLHCRLDNALRLESTSSKECLLESNRLKHSYNDLKVAIKATAPHEMVKQDSWFSGYYMKAFSPSAMPEPADGYYMSGQKGHIELEVSRSLTFAEKTLIDLAPAARRCWFPTEKRKSQIIETPAYSSEVCHLECLLTSLANICGCRPHMIRVHSSSPLGRRAVCKFSEMRCFAEHIGDRLRLSDLFEEDPGEGSCAQCWPACVTDLADVSVLWSHRSIKASKTYEGVPASNVFLESDGERPPLDLNVSTIQLSRNDKRSTCVYLRRERPELADTFGTYGGIAGLFLGIGALSVFEIIYFFLRGLTVLFHQLLIEKQN